MRPRGPLLLVFGALALFGAGVGILAADGSGGNGGQGPVVVTTATVLPQAGKLPADYFGVVAEDAFAHPGAYRATVLNRLAGLGVGLLRETFDWASIEKAPRRYDFSAYDSFISSLAARHMTVMPVLLNPPPFRSSAPAHGAQPGTYPPRSNADMAVFARALVRRYGPRGKFWKANPRLPYVPVRNWQVWNEPSLPAYWPTGPSAAEYAAMLHAVARSIHHADPGANVLTAGIPQSRLGIPFERFLSGMLDAGAAKDFDTLAIHPYARDAAGVTAAVESARRILDQHGATGSHIWVTEMGWADKGPPSAFTVGSAGQARRIQAALVSLVGIRSQAGLRGIVYFGLRDGAPYAPTFKDFWGLHTGLVNLNGRPKPALRAFGQTVTRLRRQG